jgi:hypothetical protein
MFDDRHLLPPDQDEILATVLGFEICQPPRGPAYVAEDDGPAPFTILTAHLPGVRLSCGHQARYDQLYLWFRGHRAFDTCLGCAQALTAGPDGEPCTAAVPALPCACDDCANPEA